MPSINVALIGYAFMGKAHSNAYRQVGPFFHPRLTPRMKVLCGRTPAKVRAAAREYGWDETATDWEHVVNRKDIDLVDISTPGDSHAEIAIAAARAGKAVFCEKPLGNTVPEAERMLAAVTKAGVTHMICHNYRRIPAVMLTKRLIEEGQIGEIRHFRGTYLQDWIAAHSIDLARFLVGEIAEVAGDLKTFVKTRPLPDNPRKTGRVTVDDASTALVRFKSGAIGTIEASRLAAGRKNYNRFEINGSLGSIAFDLERMNELEVYFEKDQPLVRGFRRILVTDPGHPFFKAWWPAGHIIGYEHTFVHTVYDLLEAMADGKVPTPNFEDGVRNQRVLGAIEKAAATRRWIAIANP